MKNSRLDMQFPHGADALQGDAPLITHPAENSALNARMEKEGQTQRTEMMNGNIHVPQAVAALQNGMTAPSTQELFEKAQRDWGQKHPNKPMAWSYWNPIFREAGIPSDEGLAVYDKVYPPIQSKPILGTLLTGYAEVLRARQLFYNEEHLPRTMSQPEWNSMAKLHGFSKTATKEIWRDRYFELPRTPEENVEFNQEALMHELGHAIVCINLKFPIKGIGKDPKRAGKCLPGMTLCLCRDKEAIAEMAAKQGRAWFGVILTYLEDEPVTSAWADMVACPAGVLWQQKVMERGLLPEWRHGNVGWDYNHGGHDDRRYFESLAPLITTYESASNKDKFVEAVWGYFQTNANRILDRYDVVKAWQRAGEIVRQSDVRLGRPTRSCEIYLSKEEVEDVVQSVSLGKEVRDHNIYQEEEVAA